MCEGVGEKFESFIKTQHWSLLLLEQLLADAGMHFSLRLNFVLDTFPQEYISWENSWGIKFWTIEFRFEYYSPGISRGIDLTLNSRKLRTCFKE